MSFVAPMLAKTATRASLDKPGNWDGYVAEPKHDGMRAIAVKDLDGVRFYGRSGIEYTGHVPDLVEELWWLPSGTILDGEFAVIKEANLIARQNVPVVDFNKTMRIMGGLAARAVKMQQEDKHMSFLVFDMLQWGSMELMDRPWHERRDEMERSLGHLADDFNSRVWLNPVYTMLPHFGAIYDELVENGIEGVIMKNVSAPYLSRPKGARPNKTWYKIKSEKTFDVVVMGFTDANEGKTGKFKGMIGAIKFGAYDDNGDLKPVSRCSGMNDEERQYWTNVRISADVRDDGAVMFSPFDPYVIEVKANDLVGSGQYRTPRHPQYVAMRLDKKANECLLSQFEVSE